jgi:hypothetical protein
VTLSKAKANLLQILTDEDNKVIALSGRWGTGKSHLWREVRASSKDSAIEGSLYVSLFGLTSMDQVKVKIVQSAIPKAEDDPTTWDRLKKSWSAASKVLESIHKGFSALNEIALLAVPSLLKNKVIVLDDIERKHEKLSVDEIMGFIDEFTQQHGARFVLILNINELRDKNLWETLREKVIDQEVKLETSTDEAFDIALRLTPSPYSERIRSTVSICKLTNIRIIRQIIRTINRILHSHNNLSQDILDRVIPSTVFLTAIHFKGMPDGPSFDFVLNVSAIDPTSWGKKEEELNDEERQRAKWRLQLMEAGILACDEYEKIVVDYLNSGLLESENVTSIISQYSIEADAMEAQSAVRRLRDRIIWHHELSEQILILEAYALVDKVHYLDAATVSGLHELLVGLTDGAEVANTIIERWLLDVPPIENLDVDSDFRDFFGRPLHPKIKSYYEEAVNASQASTTIYDACEWIRKHSGWGSRQEETMKKATVSDFELAIRTLEPSKLKIFMNQFLKMHLNRSTYLSSFGSATDNFVIACRNICADSSSVRLAGLIRLLFSNSEIEGDLTPAP